MRLQQIDILGFKSFRDRATVRLSDGMTAIVGPNGCGKSNVVDAIKWAMGDMSAKSLRGQSMEDVIFAGSETARAMGYAEVTLTFENSGIGEDVELGDSIPREFRDVSEIAVTRRLHRSGESEYLINKVPCRLMDIQNLLAGTGLGKQGYSIIEQNRVGFIVSSKPSERRLLIEEASGITRYKGQRDRSVRRLTKSEENLLRVNDILGEVEKQMRGLERQAKRAAQYRRFQEELSGLDIALLLKKSDALQTKITELRVAKTDAEDNLTSAKHRLETIETSLTEARERATAAEKKGAATTEAYYRAETEATLAKNRLEHSRSNLRDLKTRLEEKSEEEKGQHQRRSRLEDELETVVAALAALEDADDSKELQQQEEELSQLRALAEAAASELQAHKSELERARAALFRAEDREKWLNEQLSELAERESEADQQRKLIEGEIQSWTAREEQTTEKLKSAREAVDATKEALKVVSERAEAAAAANREASEAYQTLRTQSMRLDSEIDVLQDLRDRGEGFEEGVQAVMAWATENKRKDVLGPVADVMTGDAQTRLLAAKVLGAALSDIVVTDRKVALEAIEAIGPKSRVVFWICDGAPDAADVVGKVADKLKSKAQTITLEGGVVLHGDRVIAGEEASEAAAAIERNLRLESLLAQREQVADQTVAASERAAAAQAQVESAIESKAAAKQSVEMAHMAVHRLETEADSNARERERAEQALKRLNGQLVPLFKRQSDLKDELEKLAELRAESKEKIARLKKGAEERQKSADTTARTFDERREVLMERRVELAQRAERRRSLEEARERVNRGIASADSLIERHADERVSMNQRIKDLGEESERLAKSIEISDRNLGICKTAMEESNERAELERRAVAEIELGLREFRGELEQAQDAVRAVEMERREVALSARHCADKLSEHLSGDLDTGEEMTEMRALVAEISIPEDEWDSRRDYLRKRVESMGAVNAMAEQEYEEALERQTFLAEQRDDLEQSISDLKKAIAEMDRESRRRFKETFDAVDAKFQEVFPRLFRGGQARLILTDPDDLLTTGVDIEVRPPGKKLQNVMLLSGGEKALTAVSLIFSIFMLKPTPFSVLDEVDAPLDEANVGRFAQMVHEMSATSQMVVITHSRRTMEAADVLYGVTMEQPGVSKLVSVRLSEIDDRMAS